MFVKCLTFFRASTRAPKQIVALLATFTAFATASTVVPNVSANAATKSVTRCVTVKGKRTCKQVRVRIKVLRTTSSSLVPPTSTIVSLPIDAPVVAAPAEATPVAVPPVVTPVLIAPTPVTPSPTTIVSTQPAPTTPSVSVVPITAVPLPVATSPKSNTPGTPTTGSLGLIHKIGDAPIDDYPVALKNAPQDSTFDALRFPNRECTSFVALRVAADGRPLDSFFYQTTATWADRAAQAGYTVDGNPRPGDIAHWVANEKQTFPDGSWTQAGPVGHVGYVAAVNADGTITLEDYNGGNVRGTYTVRFNTRAPRYIHYKN
jgi:surface antigen